MQIWIWTKLYVYEYRLMLNIKKRWHLNISNKQICCRVTFLFAKSVQKVKLKNLKSG